MSEKPDFEQVDL